MVYNVQCESKAYAIVYIFNNKTVLFLNLLDNCSLVLTKITAIIILLVILAALNGLLLYI